MATAVKELIRSTESDQAQKTILEYLVNLPAREKAGEIEVEKVANTLAHKGASVYYYDVVETFRKMEEANMGRFIVGRRGHTSRFRWGASNGEAKARFTPVQRSRPAANPPNASGKSVTVTITLPMDSPLLRELLAS